MPVTDSVEPRQVRAGFGIGNDVVDGDGVSDGGDADLFDDRSAAAKHGQRVVEVRLHFTCEFLDRLAHHSETKTADAGIKIGGVVVDGAYRRCGVERIVAGDYAEELRGFADGLRDDADLVDARSERHQAVAADAAVRRL